VPLQHAALDALEFLPGHRDERALLFPRPKAATSTCTTGAPDTGAPLSTKPASRRCAASTICATPSPPPHYAPGWGPLSCRATWARASSTSTAPTGTWPKTATRTRSNCSTATRRRPGRWTLVDVLWTSVPVCRRPHRRRNPPGCSSFPSSPLPDSNRRPLPYHALRHRECEGTGGRRRAPESVESPASQCRP
jgi:hypothetical protein